MFTVYHYEEFRVWGHGRLADVSRIQRHWAEKATRAAVEHISPDQGIEILEAELEHLRKRKQREEEWKKRKGELEERAEEACRVTNTRQSAMGPLSSTRVTRPTLPVRATFSFSRCSVDM
jgi:hypothetical protein